MPHNLEIKARCADAAAVRERALRLATERLGEESQVDTYFRTRAGRLKLRESSRSGGELVLYLRPDVAGARRSDYQVIPVADPAAARRLLDSLLGVHAVVSKRREVLLHHNVRIHLDRVDGLGDFLELEAVFDGSPEAERRERERVDWLLGELGVDPRALVAGSYETLRSAG
jgi:predicted adenylyl cyclase CyaB